MLVDWHVHARNSVAKLRVLYARHLEDPWYIELVDLLRTRSPEFEAWWNDHDLELSPEGMPFSIRDLVWGMV